MMTEQQSSIYWSLFEQDNWSLHIAATSTGLCFIGSNQESYDELSKWAGTRFPGVKPIRNDEELKSYKSQLANYLAGNRSAFTAPSDLRGTTFQLEVWNALMTIPYGATSSYSEIATQIGRPSAVRAVGAAIGANPILIIVPCHRVIGKSGFLTGYRGGLEMKSTLLELEQSDSTSQLQSHI
ncbi:methylated-DNA--[protein]-cysteine S-methyltransferase [Paenibacillus sp. GSMTC-2017]|uniref:methylated-DNA--[protein]-cysteine S-methyltransferase n=1 Tax=Paenibacillus sp. GSMTC-2017 TaxID=2794350 RepID=UPI0018D7B828|nr:methylated-DNA--[protein]-cysteine S-methyltransferase [Paenibacillus sp. GSMTC-2017]MBH5320220.1 methylated-DNA--[protein]-cysteine S-methyltransferase [Paenibacillus sp. GSMTC-2017]